MKPPSLPQLRMLVRDVVIPLGGLALLTIQHFLPGERLGLIAGALAMMGLPLVSYGARKLDEPKPPDKEDGA